jgi:sec-independent protein translocase protein TatB
MLPQFSPIELMVVAIVALVVVGPRDLPKIARAIGGFVRQAQGLAREFRRSFDDMGREIELDELRKEVQALKTGGPLGEIKKEFQSVGDEMKSLDRDVRAGGEGAAEKAAVEGGGGQASGATADEQPSAPQIADKPSAPGVVAREPLSAIKEPAAPTAPHEGPEPTIHTPRPAEPASAKTSPAPEAAPDEPPVETPSRRSADGG